MNLQKHTNLFKFKILFGVLSFFIFQWLTAQTENLPESPKLQTSVYDDAGLLSAEQKTSLEQKLIHYADSTSTQIVVATVNTVNGEDIAYYATNWAHKWGIGQKGKDNGVIILVAKDDRKMTIQVGYGLEHLLTDALSRRIIEKVMVPHFREGDYYGGLDEATNVMFQIFAGEYKNDVVNEDGSIVPFLVIFIIFIVLIILISIGNKNSGGRGFTNDDDVFGPIILSRGGRGGFGGGFGGGGWSSGGGGGFSGGFGGGGFGGGGASGGW